MRENFLRAESSASGEDTARAAGYAVPPATLEEYRVLRSLTALSSLPEDAIFSLASAAAIAAFDTGDRIIQEEDYQDSGFIVISGRVALLKKSRNGRELAIKLLGPGDVLGLFLTSANPQAKCPARAHLPTRLIWIRHSKFVEILNAYPALYQDFSTQLLTSLDTLSETARALAHDRVEVRVASALSSLALCFARPVIAGEEHVIDITRQQLADLTGTTPETVIRVTGAMQRDGLLNIKRHRIIKVLNLRGLQKIIDPAWR